ncbi:FxDxF family PEP-CTERM protein [Thiobacillus denitrificans]|uniref:FxDxF family PEP-CTERM protein n=1 Tax=Thiobacillus denitrificans TaxID=36861 RepID=UPI000368D3E3|nr:FxDxF family PEP-CTERM protein [Thiobacillus denitrificans]
MKFVQTLLAFSLASAMGSAAAATPGYLGNLSGQTVSIGNSFTAGSVINDIYTFDILPLSTTVGTAVTINLDIAQFAGQEFQISNFMIAFKDSADNVIAFDDTPINHTLSIAASLAAAMGYQFVVSGEVSGTLGGSYGGALAAAPIPEAESYVMLLAGMGLVGFMVSRRRFI